MSMPGRTKISAFRYRAWQHLQRPVGSPPSHGPVRPNQGINAARNATGSSDTVQAAHQFIHAETVFGWIKPRLLNIDKRQSAATIVARKIAFFPRTDRTTAVI